MVNFWATCCAPCQEQRCRCWLRRRRNGPGRRALSAVSLEDERSVSNIQPFLSRFDVKSPVWMGANAGTLNRLRLGNGVPDTMFLDERGFVYALVLGKIQRAELDERLEWLLNGRKGYVATLLDNMQKTAHR